MHTDEDLPKKWKKVQTFFKSITGKDVDLNSALFLVGVQELGSGPRDFTKEEKQDLMHIATCKVLSLSGYYELQHVDQEGWPHWKKVKSLPSMRLKEQEDWLKLHIYDYLSEEIEYFT